MVEEGLENGDHLIPLPALFEAYDLDGDERISVQELALATGMDELETLNVAFPLCDTDDDGFLSHEEFINSPLTVEDPEDIEMEHKEVAEGSDGEEPEETSAHAQSTEDTSEDNASSEETSAKSTEDKSEE